NGTAGQNLYIAPNNTYSGYACANTLRPAPYNILGTAASNAQIMDMILESGNIYWSSGGAGGILYCTGWEDNL
ncbi:hypothetical protein ACWGS9_35945, partial [Bradyrhizobium sp. Arg314]